MVVFTATTTGDEVVKAFATEAKGKTVLITGPSEGGVGAETAISLAAGEPQEIILAGRNKGKVQTVIEQIQMNHPNVRTTFAQVDLADQSSIRKAAQGISEIVPKLDVLINNAGIMAIKDYTTTKEGIETQFGTNHVGHFLLTNLLVPKLAAAGQSARIINVSSFGYMSGGVRFDDSNFQNGAEYNPWLAYAQSKTANILFTTALTSKLKGKGILAFTITPGLIFESQLMTNISQEMFAEGHAIASKALNGDPMPAPAMTPKSLAAGSATSLYAALDPDLTAHNGAFLSDAAIWTEQLREHAVGADKAEKLWALSEELVGEKFDH